MAFELRHLRCFVALADELHFGRAAKRLAMTQPPLSVAIRQLEDAVGARLVERDSRQVRLTAAGQAFREDAQALLSRADEAAQHARQVAQGATGRLRVGLVGAMLFRGLPQWLEKFNRRHPGIEVALAELNSQAQLDALPRGEIDLAFVHSRRIPPGLQARTLFSERFMACLPASHALASRRSVRLAQLSEEPFVLFSRSVSPDYYESILGMCAEAGFYPRVRHELRHWLSVVALVAHGQGVAVVPSPLKRATLAGVVFRALSDTEATFEVRCVWSSQTPSPALQALLGTVFADAPSAAS